MDEFNLCLYCYAENISVFGIGFTFGFELMFFYRNGSRETGVEMIRAVRLIIGLIMNQVQCTIVEKYGCRVVIEYRGRRVW